MADDAGQPSRELELRARWMDVPDLRLEFAEHMLISRRNGYFIFVVGRADEPILDFRDAEAVEQTFKDRTMNIRPLGRFAVPETKMHEWAQVLTRFTAQGGDAAEIKDEDA